MKLDGKAKGDPSLGMWVCECGEPHSAFLHTCPNKKCDTCGLKIGGLGLAALSTFDLPGVYCSRQCIDRKLNEARSGYDDRPEPGSTREPARRCAACAAVIPSGDLERWRDYLERHKQVTIICGQCSHAVPNVLAAALGALSDPAIDAGRYHDQLACEGMPPYQRRKCVEFVGEAMLELGRFFQWATRGLHGYRTASDEVSK